MTRKVFENFMQFKFIYEQFLYSVKSCWGKRVEEKLKRALFLIRKEETMLNDNFTDDLNSIEQNNFTAVWIWSFSLTKLMFFSWKNNNIQIN